MLLSFSLTAAAEVPALPAIADFAKKADFAEARLSPNGEYISAMVPKGEQTVLAILRTSDLKPVNFLQLTGSNQVASYSWVGPSQVVASLGDTATFGQVVYTGELMSLNAAGGSPTYLYGYRGSSNTGSHIKNDTLEYGAATMVDPTPLNADTALIETIHYDSGFDSPTTLSRINTSNGSRTRIALAPKAGARFVTDSKGELRFAVADDSDAKNGVRVYRRKADGWEEPSTLSANSLIPRFTSSDDAWVYYSGRGLPGSKTDTACLARQPLSGGAELKLLSCDAATDVADVITSADGKEAIAVIYEADLPVIDLLKTQHPDADIFAGLQSSFGGDLVLPVSATTNGDLWLLKVYSDQNPGDYYLFDKVKKSARKLFSSREWVKPDQMRPMQVVSFTARDGASVHGYLTLPKPVEGKKPPLVVNPHGGPFFVRDHWQYNAETQLLASRGYAVLQVNFRGSDGYGNTFINTAKKNWGGVMIDDLTDAVRQVVKQGLVDGNRVGIYGGSYGGYAAVMSAVREPDLYKAVVDFAGPVDLVSQKADSDTAQYSEGRKYLNRYMGNTPEVLKANSPLTYIGQLKAPVLIVHGKDDDRVPISQAKLLREALDKKHHPYEWLAKDNEGHGFSHLASRVEFYEKLIAFLDKNLK